jgi:hypothetical protein
VPKKLVGSKVVDPTVLAAVIGAVGTVVGGVLAVFINHLFTRVRKTDEQIGKTNEQIVKTNEQIDDLFYYTMSGSMYENLEKLAEGRFYKYEMSSGLKRELYYLRDTGFIKIKRTIGEIPPQGDNLQQYVEVTDVGLKFVKRRKAMEEQKKNSSSLQVQDRTSS